MELRGTAFRAASPMGVDPNTATTRAVTERTAGQRFFIVSPSPK
jgi:hypothetical protein